jgi:hypothetical protein
MSIDVFNKYILPQITIPPLYFYFGIHPHVDSIYPDELEIIDTTKSSTSALYSDVLLNWTPTAK